MAGLFNLFEAAQRLGTGLLPTPARLYAETVMQGKKGPITEANFSEAELAAIKALIQASPGGGVGYAAYGNDQPGLSGLLSAKGRIANSLGQFNYQMGPEGTTVTDQYDFNPAYTTDSPLLQALQAMSTGGFSALHSLGEYRVPPGKGRPVRIRLKP